MMTLQTNTQKLASVPSGFYLSDTDKAITGHTKPLHHANILINIKHLAILINALKLKMDLSILLQTPSFLQSLEVQINHD